MSTNNENQVKRRFAHVKFENGDETYTPINGTVQSIKDYFKIGTTRNIGLGPNDNLQIIASVEVTDELTIA